MKYYETASDEGSTDSLVSDGADGATEESGESMLEEAAPAETPEWFLKDKYSSVEEQAKAYPELAKKLGAFTGAPEDYALEFPEGVEGELNQDDPLYQDAIAWGKKHNCSQEAMQELVNSFVGAADTAFKSTQDQIANEMKALGARADQRATEMAQWAQAHLSGEDYAALQTVCTTASNFQLMEKLVGMTKGGRLPNENGVTSESGMTPEKLRDMRYAKNENGDLKMSIDPAYNAQVKKAYAEYYGNGPAAAEIADQR